MLYKMDCADIFALLSEFTTLRQFKKENRQNRIKTATASSDNINNSYNIQNMNGTYINSTLILNIIL